MAKYTCKNCGVVFEFRLPRNLRKNKSARLNLALQMLHNGKLESKALKLSKFGEPVDVSLNYANIHPDCPACLNNSGTVWIHKKGVIP